MCPPWAWLQVERGLVTQTARLLACEHDPVSFTMPSERHDLWLAHVAGMSHLLCASVRDTWLEWLDDEPDPGAMPGLLATVHPWSQTLRRHPHLHSLVTGGSLSRTGQGVDGRHGCLLPSRVVMALFRGKRLAAVRRAVRQGQLQRPAGIPPPRGDKLRNKLGRQR
jgi:hypothetical protein